MTVEPKPRFKIDSLSDVEMVLNRLNRRMHKTMSSVMPPIPMSWIIDKPAESGFLCSSFFPCSGTIKRLACRVSKLGDKKPKLRLEFLNDVKGEYQIISLTGETTISTPNIEVFELDQLVVYIDNIEVSNIALGILFAPDRKYADVETHLISTIERIADERIRDANNSVV